MINLLLLSLTHKNTLHKNVLNCSHNFYFCSFAWIATFDDDDYLNFRFGLNLYEAVSVRIMFIFLKSKFHYYSLLLTV